MAMVLASVVACGGSTEPRPVPAGPALRGSVPVPPAVSASPTASAARPQSPPAGAASARPSVTDEPDRPVSATAFAGQCARRTYRCVRLDEAVRMWRLRPLLRPRAPGHVLISNTAEHWDDASSPWEAAPIFQFVVPDSEFARMSEAGTGDAALNGGIVVEQSHFPSKHHRQPPAERSRRVRVRGHDGFVTEVGDGLRQVLWYVPIDADRGYYYGAVDAVRYRSDAELIAFLDALPTA